MYDLNKNPANIHKITTAVQGPPKPKLASQSLENTKMQRGTSLDHILQEITNFGGLEAETEASIIGLKTLDRITKRAKSVEGLADSDDKDSLHKSKRFFQSTIDNRFKDILVNENVVIIEKSPPETPQAASTEEDVTCYNKVPVRCTNVQVAVSDMPVPNTVRRYKNIFETLSNKSGVANHKGKKTASVSRSISVRVTTADWKQAKPEYQDIIAKLETLTTAQDDRRKTLPGRLVIPSGAMSPNTSHCSSPETEEARDWLNACSPVSPDVIQKLRERGTSVTFFGRSPSSTPSPSPTTDSSDSDWSLRKPRIVGITPKIQGNSSANKPPSSLESSSTCSDDELHFSTGFELALPEADYQQTNGNGNEDDSGHDEDYYSYDVVFLNEAYTRSALPNSIRKGVWLRDPFWSGSSYIIFDFRGTNVQPHIKS